MNEKFAIAPDPFSYRRKVLYAVELFDPVSLTPVCQGVKVRAAGLVREPILNHSGRFVWLEEGDAWPTKIAVDIGDRPFEPVEDQDAKPKPADPEKAKEADRFTRIVLAPKRIYPFKMGDGVLVMRGRVVEDIRVDPLVPVLDVEIWLAWRDDDSGAWIDAPVRGKTDATGEFVTFLRLLPGVSPVVDATGDMSVVLRGAAGRETPPFFIPQGQVAQTFRTVDWSNPARSQVNA